MSAGSFCVCWAQKKRAAIDVEWRRLLEKRRPGCVVPVVRRHDGDVYATLNVMCSDCVDGDDTLAHVALGQRQAARRRNA